MSHSLVKVYVHYVWTTKNRERVLVGNGARVVEGHLTAYAKEKSIHIDMLNVQPDHVHVLVKLEHDQRIDDVVKFLKGESSHWINHNDVLPGKFSWQTGYAAFSVSYRGLDGVREYIRNQDEHHRRKSFTEEVELMLQEAGCGEQESSGMLGLGG